MVVVKIEYLNNDKCKEVPLQWVSVRGDRATVEVAEVDGEETGVVKTITGQATTEEALEEEIVEIKVERDALEITTPVEGGMMFPFKEKNGENIDSIQTIVRRETRQMIALMEE